MVRRGGFGVSNIYPSFFTFIRYNLHCPREMSLKKRRRKGSLKIKWILRKQLLINVVHVDGERTESIEDRYIPLTKAIFVIELPKMPTKN
jgi:hypothetical protein